ncbi:hypothetical protein HPB50_024329 [Hyalomma asiaticum]|uniref:Uncharacterized protein n=1 Tax=Hyalomma asiaticum TaxID=266040 RepID=A0ACB7TBD4_HYAAI|nr:hypothetical protein HPB50_024329 [Hyalomma asiaticum]
MRRRSTQPHLLAPDAAGTPKQAGLLDSISSSFEFISDNLNTKRAKRCTVYGTRHARGTKRLAVHRFPPQLRSSHCLRQLRPRTPSLHQSAGASTSAARLCLGLAPDCMAPSHGLSARERGLRRSPIRPLRDSFAGGGGARGASGAAASVLWFCRPADLTQHQTQLTQSVERDTRTVAPAPWAPVVVCCSCLWEGPEDKVRSRGTAGLQRRMATSGSTANEALVGHRAENVGDLLVDLEGARSLFSGRVLDYRTPCTASAGRTCQIVAHISVWNEFLLPIDLELRELPHTERQLALEIVYHTHQWQEWWDERERHKLKQAATALFWLLKTHHCVPTICIPYTMSDNCISLLCEALDGNTSLKSLSLRRAFWDSTISERFWKVVLSIKCLEEIKCPDANTVHPRNILAVLQSTQMLTVLHMDQMTDIDRSLSRLFLAALKANTTLRVLSVDSSAITGDPNLFVEILSDSNTLQDITVIWCLSCHPNEVKSVLRGMLKSKSILSVRIDNIILDDESVKLAAQVFAENKVLRRFRFSLCSWDFRHFSFDLDCLPDIKPVSVPASAVIWQEAIAHNSALEDLELPFNIWCAEHWEPFFVVLSTHATLKTITIVAEEKECNLLSPVMKALERTGSADKVLLKASSDASLLALPGGNCCSELYAYLSDRTRHEVLPVLQRLSTFSHLKELSLTFFSFCNQDIECCTAILEYIAAASTLQKLDMDINVFQFPLGLVEWLQALSRSLLLNRSITELGIGGYFERSEGLGGLGEAVSQSHTIRKFHLLSFKDKVALEAFIRGLRVNIFENYALCSAMFKSGSVSESLEADWFEVTDTARRNYGLVARAAHFLNNMRPDR